VGGRGRQFEQLVDLLVARGIRADQAREALEPLLTRHGILPK
jgi:hypothetical protein